MRMSAVQASNIHVYMSSLMLMQVCISTLLYIHIANCDRQTVSACMCVCARLCILHSVCDLETWHMLCEIMIKALPTMICIDSYSIV